MKKIVFLVVMTLTSASVFSAPVIHMGVGGVVSCGTFLNGTPSETQDRLSWAVGYLSGINSSGFFGKTDILLTSDLGGIKANLVNYCTNHPLEKFLGAVQQTAIDLALEARKK